MDSNSLDTIVSNDSLAEKSPFSRYSQLPLTSMLPAVFFSSFSAVFWQKEISHTVAISK